MEAALSAALQSSGTKTKTLAEILNTYSFAEAAALSSLSETQDVLSALFYEVDPADLRGAPGLPRNEYEPEAALILMNILGAYDPAETNGTGAQITRFIKDASENTRQKIRLIAEEEDKGIIAVRNAIKEALLPILTTRGGKAWAEEELLEMMPTLELTVQSILISNKRNSDDRTIPRATV